MRCGINRLPAGSAEIDFCTPQYAVVYLHDGRGAYTDDGGVEHEVAPGSFFQRFPSRPHSIALATSSMRCWIAVPCQVFELLSLMGLASHARPVVHVGSDRKLVRAFAGLRDDLDSCDEGGLIELLMRMQRFLVSLHQRGRTLRAEQTVAAPIARAEQLLSEDLGRRVRMPAVARRVGMNYATFRKLFTEQVGTPPGEYRIRRRIERAMAMLTQTASLVKDIAASLGYPDEYAFSAQFKKMTGVSPGAFRRRNP
jgi:AraC-like DNA-binding protein